MKDGKPKVTTIKVWQDANSATSPLYETENVTPFVTLNAKLGHLKKSDLAETVTRLADGFDYYRINGAVEATFYGISTKYCLIYRGMCFFVKVRLQTLTGVIHR